MMLLCSVRRIEISPRDEKPITSYNMLQAKQTSSAVIKGFNDINTMFQHVTGPAKLPGAPGTNPAGGYLQDFDSNMIPKEEVLPKKYTWRQIDDMLTEARYFIIKSSNQENINLSRKHSEWATTRSNEVRLYYLEAKLNEAYESCKNVILIFSVNKSAHFMGFARMTSTISNRVAHYWKNTGSNWLTKRP